MEDIQGQLKNLEEQHVWAVRELEKLTRIIDHIRAAREEFDVLVGVSGSNLSLRSLPERLRSVEETLEEEISRTRAYILDVELDQAYLRKRLQGGGRERPAP